MTSRLAAIPTDDGRPSQRVDLKPEPVNTPERPNPAIVQGGNSTAARRYADWYL